MSELFLGHPFIAPVIELARQAGEVDPAVLARRCGRDVQVR